MIEFKLPALGENIEQGDLVRLMIAPGAAVSEGQAVMELETDKAVVEVPSSVTGTVREILVKEGEKIKVGQTVFTADNNGNSVSIATDGRDAAPSQTKAPKSAVPQVTAPESAPPAPSQTQPASEVEPQANGTTACRDRERIQAARIGREHFAGRFGPVNDRPRCQGLRRTTRDGARN